MHGPLNVKFELSDVIYNFWFCGLDCFAPLCLLFQQELQRTCSMQFVRVYSTASAAFAETMGISSRCESNVY
jgi:hypothetical protein